jgi:hypothetical protein
VIIAATPSRSGEQVDERGEGFDIGGRGAGSHFTGFPGGFDTSLDAAAIIATIGGETDADRDFSVMGATDPQPVTVELPDPGPSGAGFPPVPVPLEVSRFAPISDICSL